ncbi:MAG: sensor histidine kinase, partial [Ktedonobacteraceae bacterium]|nr:sensor histidine kinase [Ktedonobacteraceae bacterium]
QNAIKYSPQGGPVTISLRQIIDGEGRACAEVQVQDKGIGVPVEVQSRLFERFYRAPNSSGSQERGAGLGLYVVAEFLRLHGGNIWVESSGIEGEGSCFIFTLPLLLPVSSDIAVSSDGSTDEYNSHHSPSEGEYQAEPQKSSDIARESDDSDNEGTGAA